MPAASTDSNEILKAVARAYNLSCREGSPNSSDHPQVIGMLVIATLAVMKKCYSLILSYPGDLIDRHKSGKLTGEQTRFRSLGSSSMYKALVAQEAFTMVRNRLSEGDYRRLAEYMEKYTLAFMAESLGRAWCRIRTADKKALREVRKGLRLPAPSNSENFDKAWIAEANHLTRVLLQDSDHLPSGVNANGLSYSYAVQLLRLADQRRAEKRDADSKAAFVEALRTLELISDKSIHLLLALHAASWARTTTSSV